jgi:molybdenum cofactor cytidylyltransferase
MMAARLPRIVGVILAAGRSRRMGRAKQLLPYRGATVLEAVVASARAAGLDGLMMVTNLHVHEALAGRLTGDVHVVINPDAESEMLASVQCAVRAFASGDIENGGDEPRRSYTGEDACLVLLGDQPQVTGEAISACAVAYRSAPGGIVIATYNGRRGHPAVFALSLMHEAINWGPERRLNELARQHAALVREIPIAAGAPLDINTPEDYERLCD